MLNRDSADKDDTLIVIGRRDRDVDDAPVMTSLPRPLCRLRQ
jgi:hypothetical protein